MKTRDFSFELPAELIAQHPAEHRGTSRLLTMNRTTGDIRHLSMADIRASIPPNSVMVFNDSRVRKARLYGKSVNGGVVELLLVSRIGPTTWQVLTSKSRKQKTGKEFKLPDGVSAKVVGVDPPFRNIEFSDALDDKWLDKHGHVPLPPYIERPDEMLDAERYQTVYSRLVGSIAAPTAGLHFTNALLAGLKSDGIDIQFVTLHVGAGTFFPIRSSSIDEHTMHEESYEISEACALAVNRAKMENRRVISVGTTSLRCLEAASADGQVHAGNGSTDIFIRPGYTFKTVDGLFTNFHTPESTLLVLVSAFAGLESIRETYRTAVEQRYRFFSYGDAMLIL